MKNDQSQARITELLRESCKLGVTELREGVRVPRTLEEAVKALVPMVRTGRIPVWNWRARK